MDVFFLAQYSRHETDHAQLDDQRALTFTRLIDR